MRQPPRRRTVPFPTGSNVVPYNHKDVPTPGLDDLDPTRSPSTVPSEATPRASRRRYVWAVLPLLILAIGLPLSWPYVSPVWERLPRPDLSALSTLSERLTSRPPAKPKPTPVATPAVAFGNDAASCQTLQDRIDQMSRLVLAGVLDSVTVAAVDTSMNRSTLHSTCLDGVAQITTILADELVAQELYFLDENNALVEKTPRELEANKTKMLPSVIKPRARTRP